MWFLLPEGMVSGSHGPSYFDSGVLGAGDRGPRNVERPLFSSLFHARRWGRGPSPSTSRLRRTRSTIVLPNRINWNPVPLHDPDWTSSYNTVSTPVGHSCPVSTATRPRYLLYPKQSHRDYGESRVTACRSRPSLCLGSNPPATGTPEGAPVTGHTCPYLSLPATATYLNRHYLHPGPSEPPGCPLTGGSARPSDLPCLPVTKVCGPRTAGRPHRVSATGPPGLTHPFQRPGTVAPPAELSRHRPGAGHRHQGHRTSPNNWVLTPSPEADVPDSLARMPSSPLE